MAASTIGGHYKEDWAREEAAYVCQRKVNEILLNIPIEQQLSPELLGNTKAPWVSTLGGRKFHNLADAVRRWGIHQPEPQRCPFSFCSSFATDIPWR